MPPSLNFQTFLLKARPKMNCKYPFLSQEQIMSRLRLQWRKITQETGKTHETLNPSSSFHHQKKGFNHDDNRTPSIKNLKNEENDENNLSKNRQNAFNVDESGIDTDDQLKSEQSQHMDSQEVYSPYMMHEELIDKLNAGFYDTRPCKSDETKRRKRVGKKRIKKRKSLQFSRRPLYDSSSSQEDIRTKERCRQKPKNKDNRVSRPSKKVCAKGNTQKLLKVKAKEPRPLKNYKKKCTEFSTNTKKRSKKCPQGGKGKELNGFSQPLEASSLDNEEFDTWNDEEDSVLMHRGDICLENPIVTKKEMEEAQQAKELFPKREDLKRYNPNTRSQEKKQRRISKKSKGNTKGGLQPNRKARIDNLAKLKESHEYPQQRSFSPCTSPNKSCSHTSASAEFEFDESPHKGKTHAVTVSKNYDFETNKLLDEPVLSQDISRYDNSNPQQQDSSLCNSSPVNESPSSLEAPSPQITQRQDGRMFACSQSQNAMKGAQTIKSVPSDKELEKKTEDTIMYGWMSEQEDQKSTWEGQASCQYALEKDPDRLDLVPFGELFADPPACNKAYSRTCTNLCQGEEDSFSIYDDASDEADVFL